MKQIVFKILKILKIFDLLKQLKISYVSNFKRDTKIDFIDLSKLSYSKAGIKLAKEYKQDIINNLPLNYDDNIIDAYELLKKLDKNITDELDAMADYLQIDKYLILAKDFLFIPETCTSVALKENDNMFIGQNLDLGYDGSQLLVKKYKDYITVGLKNHPLWSTVGINKFGISYTGSSVNSIRNGGGTIIPSIMNSKIILSAATSINEVIDFFNTYKFYIGNDAGSYTISDNESIHYMECDSQDFSHERKDNYAFTTNKFINLDTNNLFVNINLSQDAIKREKYFKAFNILNVDGFNHVKVQLSSHEANICAHSSKTVRYTTCTSIIDKKNNLFYFTKELPCKIKSKEDFFSIEVSFNK